MADSSIPLLDRVRRGEAAALALLVGRHQPSALRLAKALLGDHHLAEEAVQEAFVAAILQLPSLRCDAAFAAWFRQIVRTQANRLQRRATARPSPSLPDEPSREPSPDMRLETEELRQQVHLALTRLAPAGRETAELFYLEQRSIAEIAARLDVPVGTVKRRLHDARRRLREVLIGCVESLEVDAAREARRTKRPL